MRAVLSTIVTLTLLTGQGPPLPGAPPASQPSRDTPPRRPVLAASVEGRVVDEERAQPIRWATVTLTAGDLSLRLSTSTDADGRYRFDSVPAGNYVLFASKAGFIGRPAGGLPSGDPSGRPQVAVTGARTANFTLARGGAIQGRILSDHGDPVQDVLVQALRLAYDSSGRRLVAVGRPARTDDLGGFRLHSLSPGRYFIEAFPAGLSPVLFGDTLEATQRTASFPRNYYPGTPRVNEAQRVAVGPALTTEVEFTLTRTPVARISGRVVDSLGNAPASATAVLRSVSGIQVGGMSVVVNRGDFGLPNVPAGEYWLVVMARPLGSEPELAISRVSVSGENLTNLTIRTAPGLTVEGRVESEASGETMVARGLPIVALNTLSPGIIGDPNGPATPARVAPDGRFTFRSLFGPRLFRMQLAQGWAIKAILLNDIDISDTPMDFRGPGAPQSLRIVLTNRTGTLSGAITVEGATNALGYQIVVFAEDERRWGFESRFTKVADVAADGRFTVKGLLPGRYWVAAVRDLEPGSWSDTEVLSQFRPVSSSVVISEGAENAVTMKVRQIP